MLSKGVIISVQPAFGDSEEFYDSLLLDKMIDAALLGQANGLRLEGADVVQRTLRRVDIPVIAITKKFNYNSYTNRNITVGLSEIKSLYNVGARVIAVDFTFRDDMGFDKYSSMMKKVKQKYAGLEIVADVSTFEEGVAAKECCVDYISTTLCGYTACTKNNSLPNFTLLEELVSLKGPPIIAEGGYFDLLQLNKAQKIGCFAIVFGTAVTRPHIVTQRFVNAWSEYEKNSFK